MMTASILFTARRCAAVALAACVLATGVASPAVAQDQRTPKGWSYDIKGGKPVRKGDRVTNADGSWREVIRQGKCVTVKEKTAAGEYRETRECSPN
ncbi:MAG: hypothetical protein ABIS23_02725 [Sphingomicrobium sp.]